MATRHEDNHEDDYLKVRDSSRLERPVAAREYLFSDIDLDFQ